METSTEAVLSPKGSLTEQS